MKLTNNYFFQIGQIASMTDLPHSTIRFWELKFPDIKPYRTSGKHRYYDKKQLELIIYIKKLLYTEGYTIKGAQIKIKNDKKYVSSANDTKENIMDIESYNKVPKKLTCIKKELEEISIILDKSII